MVSLRSLDLSFNQIARIEGLGHLRSLVELNLSENLIEKIENLVCGSVENMCP